jgi:pimeloyl-ACP methyl ester carboxylesterase
LRRPQEFEPERRDLAEMTRYPKGTGGFSKLFAELERCVRRDAGCLVGARGASFADGRITLIAHSLGGIIVNELIRSYDEVPYREVVYMGAANSIRQFLETAAPVMESQLDLQVYNLMLHPVADSREVTGQGLAPSGSLLQWVDEMYEGPPAMLDRTFGKWVNVKAAAYVFPPHLRDRLHFRVFGFRAADRERRDPGDPTTHGEFNDTDMHYWLPDFWNGQARPAN